MMPNWVVIEIGPLHKVHPVFHMTSNHIAIIALTVYEKQNVEQRVQDFVFLHTVLKFR